MNGTETRQGTSFAGARVQSRTVLFGTVSAIALAQVAAAGVAYATAGPCSLDATTPGTHVYTCTDTIATTADSNSAVSYSVAGGNGTNTGYAGTSGNNLTVNSTATISTVGAASHGIAAHSAGGHGGNGYGAVFHDILGGNGGAGGAVTVTNGGTIGTSGAGSHGISATSIGGNAAATISGEWSGNQLPGGAGGRAGDISVTNTGTITTTGVGAHGIYAASTAGANYYGGSAGGAAGNVTVTSSGNITTSGRAAAGISAVAPAGSIAITVNGSVTTSGSSSEAIILNASNGPVTLDIGANGLVASEQGRSIDVRSSGIATINNSGTVRGDVLVYAREGSAFNNNAGGLLETGTSFNLNGPTLNNAGTISPGGNGTITRTSILANFVQTSTGVLKVDADWTGNSGAGSADVLAITGTANLAGTVVVTPINFPSTGGLTKQFTVLTATGGITNNGISIANTAAVNYALLYPDANTMNVQATINFQGVGLNNATPNQNSVCLNNLTPNQNSVGGNLNIILGGGKTLGFMPGLMQIPSGGSLGGALNQLAPSGDGGSFSSTMTTGNAFGQQLLSCRMAGEEGDTNRFIREGQCVWARVNARRFDSDARTDSSGYKENALFYSAGAQLAVARDWRVGAGLGYETVNARTDSNASSTGDRLHLGGVVKYTPGPWLMAASVTGGFGWHDNSRNVSFGGFAATATSQTDTSFVASRLTAAYLLSHGAFYAKPQVELTATHLMRDGFTETATGGIALAVAKSSDTVLSASPSLELGVEQRGTNGFVTRAFVKGGATFRDTDTFVTTATFADAPGTPAFAISSKVDKTVADLGAGLDLISAGDTALRLQYDGQFGDRTTLHSGGAKLSVKF